jgi:hypothetical protein
MLTLTRTATGRPWHIAPGAILEVEEASNPEGEPRALVHVWRGARTEAFTVNGRAEDIAAAVNRHAEPATGRSDGAALDAVAAGPPARSASTVAEMENGWTP